MLTSDLPKSLAYLPDEKKILLKHTLGGRLRLLITAMTPEKKRFNELEAISGIPSATWRTWWRRDVAPSCHFIEAAAKAWPEHAFWLATGITDVEAGHTMPTPPALVKPYIDPFPETPFSAKSIKDFPLGGNNPITWASTSAEHCGVLLGDTRFGQWPDGAYEFLEYTAQYLRSSLKLQTLYWDDEKRQAGETPAMQILDGARLMARSKRWKYQLNREELKA
jgi:hypothetical protein